MRAGLMAGTALVLVAATQAAFAQDGFRYFNRTATLPVYNNLPDGTAPETETVAEIISATADGSTLVYTDSEFEALGFIDFADPTNLEASGLVALGGEPTSVTVVGGMALAGVNTSESYTEPSGHVAVVAIADHSIVATCDVGGQPDSIAASPDGAFLAVAIENERDEDLNDGAIPQLPAGSLAIFDLGADGVPTNCDAARIVDLTGLAEVAPDDPEPEFVDINDANIAVVTMQENNHVALVDLATGEVTGHFSAGTVDLEAIDTEDDGRITGNSALADVPREPDAVAWLDDERIITADEGDYEGGSRGFTIFDTTGNVLHATGNAMEHMGMRHGHYPEGRADNKGVEPEGVEVGRFGDRTLIFVNAERGNFVAVYEDQGADAAPEFIQFLPTAVGPEGLLALPAMNAFVVASEVDAEEDGLRSAVNLYVMDAAQPAYPHLVSADDPATGAPIGWGALSGLAPHASDADTIHAVSDSFYSPSRIFTIALGEPSEITGYVELSKDGEPAAYDLEGIALRDGGGFWLVSEGNPEHDNPLRQRSTLLHVSEDGAVEEEIHLPDSVLEHAIRFGFEGVTATGSGDDERVIVAFQRAWEDDPEGHAKLGVYSPASGEWGFVHFPLEAPKSPRGGWVGLSEISALGDNRF
ncbi:MAG: esterase-like activity of phytase family protein, partial [Pseudomonadota bacterium]